MRTSLRDIREIDRYLLHQMNAADRLLFQAKIRLSEELKQKVQQQRKVHRMILLLGREAQRSRLAALHRQLMANPFFNDLIASIFKT